jgi:hypothetical protein
MQFCVNWPEIALLLDYQLILVEICDFVHLVMIVTGVFD